MTSKGYEIAARGALGVRLGAGASVKVINSSGSQVVATWAFAGHGGPEFMSMEHTRIHAETSRPQPGTVFYTNQHRPILEMTADSSPRVHDWYLAACNQQRYNHLGHDAPHANCEDNLLSVLQGAGVERPVVPCPLNLFENVSFLYGGPMEIKPPLAMPGDFVSLKALVDCLVVLSACPQDILPTNGPDLVPCGVSLEVSASATGQAPTAVAGGTTSGT